MEINIAKNSGFCFRINRALRIAKKARIRETEESMGPAAKNLNQIINKILPHTNAIQKANQFIQKRLTGAKKKVWEDFSFLLRLSLKLWLKLNLAISTNIFRKRGSNV